MKIKSALSIYTTKTLLGYFKILKVYCILYCNKVSIRLFSCSADFFIAASQHLHRSIVLLTFSAAASQHLYRLIVLLTFSDNALQNVILFVTFLLTKYAQKAGRQASGASEQNGDAAREVNRA